MSKDTHTLETTR